MITMTYSITIDLKSQLMGYVILLPQIEVEYGDGVF